MGYGDLLFINKPGQGHKGASAADRRAANKDPWAGGRPQPPQDFGPPGPGVPGGPAPAPTHYHHPTAPAPAPYVPPPPPPGQDSVNYTPVKIPDAEVVVFLQDQVSADALQKLYFEDVGGTEILAVARHDTVGGEPVATSPIANLEDIKLQFNPLNILSSINTNELFNQFAINMSSRVWDTNDSVYGEAEWVAGVDEDGFSTNTLKGYIIVDIDDLKADEYIQIQVAGNNVDYDTYDESWYNGSGGTP